MSISLNETIGTVVLASVLLSGCQSAQLAQRVQPSEPLMADAQEVIPVLYPVRFNMRLQSGTSGTLLPEDLDAQLLPLLEQVDQWQQVTRVVVVGHTDGEGSEKSNLLLSIRRANAMADKLVDYGIPEAALEVDGRGEYVPVADNNSISGKKLNRRIEVIVEGLIGQSVGDSIDRHAENPVHAREQVQLGKR